MAWCLVGAFKIRAPWPCWEMIKNNFSDVIISTMASQITGVSIVQTTVLSGADQRKHQSSAILAFVRGNHQWPVKPPPKGPLTRKMFPYDDVIMCKCILCSPNIISTRQELLEFSCNWAPHRLSLIFGNITPNRTANPIPIHDIIPIFHSISITYYIRRGSGFNSSFASLIHTAGTHNNITGNHGCYAGVSQGHYKAGF